MWADSTTSPPWASTSSGRSAPANSRVHAGAEARGGISTENGIARSLTADTVQTITLDVSKVVQNAVGGSGHVIDGRQGRWVARSRPAPARRAKPAAGPSPRCRRPSPIRAGRVVATSTPRAAPAAMRRCASAPSRWTPMPPPPACSAAARPPAATWSRPIRASPTTATGVLLGDVGRLDNVAALASTSSGRSAPANSRVHAGAEARGGISTENGIARSLHRRHGADDHAGCLQGGAERRRGSGHVIDGRQAEGGWRDRGRARDGRNPPQVHHRGAGDRLRSARAGSWRRQHREQRQR